MREFVKKEDKHGFAQDVNELQTVRWKVKSSGQTGSKKVKLTIGLPSPIDLYTRASRAIAEFNEKFLKLFLILILTSMKLLFYFYLDNLSCVIFV